MPFPRKPAASFRPRPRPTVLILAVAAALLAACSAPGEGAGGAGEANAGADAEVAAGRGPPAEEARAAVSVAPTPARPTDAARAPEPLGVTVGGDGSSIRLAPLSPAEIAAAKLPGELGCSFSPAGSAPILVAMGDVASKEPAWGVVKVGSYVERIAAPGGFDPLPKGVTFSGAGKTIRIALAGPGRGGGESPPAPATLTYDRADGARLTLAGRWSCGP